MAGLRPLSLLAGDSKMEGAGILVLMVVIGWASCICLGAYISMQKNRPDIEGVLLGMFLGPLGVIIAALLPGQSPPVPPVAPAPPEPAPQRQIRVTRPRPAKPSIPDEPIPQTPGDWGTKMDEDEAMRFLED